MFRASYTYKFKIRQDHKFLIIIDQGFGKSVTNDMENVLTDIADKEKIDLDNYLIVYRDSIGEWDGWDNKKRDFVFLSGHSEESAMESYLELV